MPQYKIAGRDKSGKTKTVKVIAHSADEAEQVAAAENRGFVFKDAELLKGDIKIVGAFVYRTFVSAAISSGYDEKEAKQIFEDRLRSGIIVNSGTIGILGGANKFEMK